MTFPEHTTHIQDQTPMQSTTRLDFVKKKYLHIAKTNYLE